MSSLDESFWGGPRAELERLAGPLHPVPGAVSAYEVLEGTYRGERVRASWLGRVRSGGGASGSTLHLAASLDGRPVRTYVWSRKGSTIFGPTAVTGDAAFDERYVASARPQEVVSAALDADVRAMIDRRWAGSDTSIDVDDGWVSIAAGTSEPGPRGPRTPPTGDQLQSILDDVVLLTGRLRHAYDTRWHQIAAEQGEPAARAWAEQAQADLTATSRKGLALAVAVIVGMVVVVAALVAGILALVG